MSEGPTPFTEYAKKTTRPQGASPAGWVVAGLLVIGLAVVGVLWHRDAAKVDALRARLNDAETNLTSNLAARQRDKDAIAGLQSQVAELEKEKEMAGQKSKGLEDELRSDLESKDVTISKLQGKLTVNILDRVMFDSGEAMLKPDGETVLRKVAAILAGHPELKIHVIGHTDNLPIRNRFASNWELSTARALAAVHFLTEKAGLDPHRVGAVGYGEYRPLADNATPEGRAKNRRIAITILPDELANADAVPIAPSPTPAPPAK